MIKAKPIVSKPVDMQESGINGFLKQARERSSLASAAWQDNFNTSEEDVLFAYGEQWDEKTKMERMQEGRPTLTLNKLGQYIYRLVGDQRQNVQTIKFSPVQGNANAKMMNTAGTKDFSVAEVYESISRNIENVSNATYHYKLAFQHSVEGGFGWLRVLTNYSTSDAFELDLKIEAIRNRWSVLIDPSAKEPDYSDANYCFISERMTKEEFDKRYPDKKMGELQNTKDDSFLGWGDKSSIKISEYFVRRPIVKELVLMNNGDTYWMQDIKDVIDELKEQGVTITRTRKVNTYKVEWYKITAWDILEGPIEWCGDTIPVVPVLGKEIDVKGQRFYRGIINEAKDAQRMLNYWQSAATERVALAPKAPWIAPADSIENYMPMWQTANVKNWAVLPYTPTANGERPFRQDPPPMPSSELSIAANSEEGIKSSIGIYDAMLGNRSNENSGIAIQRRQQQGDTATFVYTDNLNLAIRRVGKILCEAIPIVYDSNRVIRLSFADGSGDFVEINKTIHDNRTDTDVVIHDLSTGKYDVVVETGPQYSTQRQESMDAMMELAKVVPQIAQVAPDLLALNIDAPNMGAIADRLKHTVPINLLSQEDQEEMAKNAPPPAPPAPEVQQAQIQMQGEQAKMQGDQQLMQIKLQIEQIKLQQTQLQSQLKVTEAQAKTTSSNSNDEGQDSSMIQSMVHDAVAQVMAELIAHSRSQQAPQQEAQDPATEENTGIPSQENAEGIQ